MNILHITPHLGGGIGKVLSELVEHSNNVSHNIVSLEHVIDRQYINKINETGTKVIESPSLIKLEDMINKADIVQLEFWNHPALFDYLCNITILPIRLVVWFHKNGLYNFKIPIKLIKNSHKFVFTSPCSYQINCVKHSDFDDLKCVYSSGGFKDFPEVDRRNETLSVGYFGGSTSFSKMSPYYVDYINKIDKINNINKIKIIGNVKNKQLLEGLSKKAIFTGFVPNTIDVLKSINVNIYLLNKQHYGTTENALLESMSMGIVPIVMNNLPEKCIVDNEVTGFVINNKFELSNVINYLYENPTEIHKIGKRASEFVRKEFSIEKTESELNKIYKEVMFMGKRKISFRSIFGNSPSKWFLSCSECNKKVDDLESIYILFDKTNGSIFHFSEYFSKNKELKKWSKNLMKLL